jgi:hypothetical protein
MQVSVVRVAAVALPFLVLGAAATVLVSEWRHELARSAARAAASDVAYPITALARPTAPALVPPAVPASAGLPFEQPIEPVIVTNPEEELVAKRRSCEARLIPAGATEGIQVSREGRSGILFKSPKAGGTMAQQFLKAGLFDNLATNCAFRSVTLVDGRYFSATWGLPPSVSEIQQIAIIAERERHEAANAERGERLMGSVRKWAQEVKDTSDCARLYPDNASAFEICRQGALGRASGQ